MALGPRARPWAAFCSLGCKLETLQRFGKTFDNLYYFPVVFIFSFFFFYSKLAVHMLLNIYISVYNSTPLTLATLSYSLRPAGLQVLVASVS